MIQNLRIGMWNHWHMWCCIVSTGSGFHPSRGPKEAIGSKTAVRIRNCTYTSCSILWFSQCPSPAHVKRWKHKANTVRNSMLVDGVAAPRGLAKAHEYNLWVPLFPEILAIICCKETNGRKRACIDVESPFVSAITSLDPAGIAALRHWAAARTAALMRLLEVRLNAQEVLVYLMYASKPCRKPDNMLFKAAAWRTASHGGLGSYSTHPPGSTRYSSTHEFTNLRSECN